MTNHTWNHRVIRHVTPVPNRPHLEEEYLQIHEVFYENGIPKSVTEDGVKIGGDTVEEMKETLERMIHCLSLPIIDKKYFDDLEMDEILSKEENEELKEVLKDIQTNEPKLFEKIQANPDKFMKAVMDQNKEYFDIGDDKQGC